MASEATQVPAQESNGAPPKAPEEASGIKPTDEKSSEQPAVQAEPTKLDEPATNTAPAGTVADGSEQQKVPEHGTFLKDKTPPQTSGPDPTDASSAQAAEPAKEPAQQPTTEVTPSGSGPSAPPAEDTAAKALNGEGHKSDVDMRDAAPAPEESVNAPAEGALKRKADDEPAAAPANGDSAGVIGADAKKAKTDAAADPIVPTPAETNGHGGEDAAAAKKAGRPKKEKKEQAPPGKTARRTRSQGPLAA